MSELIFKAEDLANKVILSQKEYQSLKNRGVSKESYESLTTAHAELHKKYSELEQENQSLRDAFNEVCHDIRNLAPKYAHPLEVISIDNQIND